MASQHSSIKSDGMVLNPFCESQGCRSPVKFYCVSCNKHICNGCKYENHANHSPIVTLNDMNVKEKISQMQDQINKAEKCMKEESNKFRQILKEFE